MPAPTHALPPFTPAPPPKTGLEVAVLPSLGRVYRQFHEALVHQLNAPGSKAPQLGDTVGWIIANAVNHDPDIAGFLAKEKAFQTGPMPDRDPVERANDEHALGKLLIEERAAEGMWWPVAEGLNQHGTAPSPERTFFGAVNLDCYMAPKDWKRLRHLARVTNHGWPLAVDAILREWMATGSPAIQGRAEEFEAVRAAFLSSYKPAPSASLESAKGYPFGLSLDRYALDGLADKKMPLHRFIDTLEKTPDLDPAFGKVLVSDKFKERTGFSKACVIMPPELLERIDEARLRADILLMPFFSALACWVTETDRPGRKLPPPPPKPKPAPRLKAVF